MVYSFASPLDSNRIFKEGTLFVGRAIATAVIAATAVHYYAGRLGESLCRYCYSSDSDSDSCLEEPKLENESPEAIFSYLYSKQETNIKAVMHLVQRPDEPDLSTLNFPDSDTD